MGPSLTSFTLNTLLDTAQGAQVREVARLASLGLPRAGCWLNATHIPALGRGPYNLWWPPGLQAEALVSSPAGRALPPMPPTKLYLWRPYPELRHWRRADNPAQQPAWPPVSDRRLSRSESMPCSKLKIRYQNGTAASDCRREGIKFSLPGLRIKPQTLETENCTCST